MSVKSIFEGENDMNGKARTTAVILGLMFMGLVTEVRADEQSTHVCGTPCGENETEKALVTGEQSASCSCVASVGDPVMDDVPVPSTPETPTDGLLRDPND